ncbi:PREDICTED: uncharacterized protein LOC106954875 [Pelobates cultripes]|uniref:PREDICTED: uncharacterized protein LOC106954875 n=1 Tax=Pelobates cultripes TaxID=61616 RepID=A0AAD1RZG5_PELCU|nr:PREDICTED: uncharacterized protein LOC106954875 [Pelobates cultripes]
MLCSGPLGPSGPWATFRVYPHVQEEHAQQQHPQHDLSAAPTPHDGIHEGHKPQNSPQTPPPTDTLAALTATRTPKSVRSHSNWQYITAVTTLTFANDDPTCRNLPGAQGQQCQAYTRDFIPVDKSLIPTKETVLQWSHLKHLTNKLQKLHDCEVGLLICYDCPSALAPLEVITGYENELFTQRTVLGWSIIGSTNPHLDRQGSQNFIHKVAVKEIPLPLVTDVLKALEIDFIERNYEDRYVSQDDVRFVQFLSETIMKRNDGHYEMPLPFKDKSTGTTKQ